MMSAHASLLCALLGSTINDGVAAESGLVSGESAVFASPAADIERCMIAPRSYASDTNLASALPGGAGAIREGERHRIVIRNVIVRRSDGSGGMDESLLHYFLRDLNYGYRDAPFVYVNHPQIRYHDDDNLYANIPDWPTATALLTAHAEPGVLVHIFTPTIFGGPPVTGLNYPWTPRGNIMAYHRIGQPDSIVFPPHEVGHTYAVYHPYETRFGAECTSGSNCATAGDRLCDTPASPAVHSGNTTATGIFFANIPGPCAGDPRYAPLTDLYMEAGWPAGHILRDRFTAGQVTQMLSHLAAFSPDLIGHARPDVLVDCDGNGIDDIEEILDGLKPDVNRDMVPDGCQILPRMHDLLVSGMTNDVRNRVRIFDGQTGAFRETMWNGMTWAHQLRMGPDGLVYLTRLTIVQRLDLRTGRTTDNFIDGVLEGAQVFVDLLFEADGNILVLDNVAKNILRYDGQTGAFLGLFANLRPVNMTNAKYMEYGPDQNIYVVGNGAAGSTIQRIDSSDGTLLGSFITPGAGGLSGGQGLRFHTDGRLYVSNRGGNNVLRYDALSGDFIDVFVSSNSGGLSNPHSLRFGPDGNLYVASRNNDAVKRYNGITGAFIDNFVTPGADGMDQPAGLLFPDESPCNPCDMNCDGGIDALDIEPLLDLLFAGGVPCDVCTGDVNGDGNIDALDIEPFLNCLFP